MTIKEIVELALTVTIDADFITNAKNSRSELSASDRRTLLGAMAKFKIVPITTTIKYIEVYAIWEPDDAIWQARKKGIFRYVAHQSDDNVALHALTSLLCKKNFFKFSDETQSYLKTKIGLSWLYDYYKSVEANINEIIKLRHDNCKIECVDGITVESALFKDLLAYTEICFFLEPSNTLDCDKNTISGYSREEISEAVSYIIFLYNKEVGVDGRKKYMVDSEYVLSDDIEKLVLLACKVIKVQEWETTIDYFDYKVRCDANITTIYDEIEAFEKSVRLGYINYAQQNTLLFSSPILEDENNPSIGAFVAATKDLKASMFKPIGTGNVERYRLEFPEPLLSFFYQKGGDFFKEEIIMLGKHQKDYMLNADDLLTKHITETFTVRDLILFQRFFLVVGMLKIEFLYNDFCKRSRKEKMRIINSSVIEISKKELAKVLTNFISSPKCIEEILRFFTYEDEKKLDLQYTPFLPQGDSLIFSNMLVAESNLVRNGIAYSHYIKNTTVNNSNVIEPLVEVCAKIFTKDEYLVLKQKRFKYYGKNGEIDVIVIHDNDIVLIECKESLHPINNFELRASVDHIEKANNQLTNAKVAFSDDNFYKEFCKNNNVDYKNRNILTCIVLGNRLFCGYEKSEHPVRFIYELGMVLNEGKITSEMGEWSVRREEIYSHQDLLDFLSDEKCFVNYTYESMEKNFYKITAGDKKLEFETYLLNMLTVVNKFDQHLRIINENKELKEKMNKEYQELKKDEEQ